MKNKKRNTPREGFLGRFLYGALSVFLILIFLICIGGGLSQLRESASGYYYDYYEEENYLTRLRNENYADLLEMTQDDCRAGKVYKGDVPECRALAMYYEAAVFYNAYEKTGDQEKAAVQKERMERFRQEAGSYDYYTEKIDALVRQAAER